jgi:hypothetical protein
MATTRATVPPTTPPMMAPLFDDVTGREVGVLVGVDSAVLDDEVDGMIGKAVAEAPMPDNASVGKDCGRET